MKKFLKTLGMVVLIAMLAIAAVIGFAAYANHAAERAARTFCDNIRIGAELDPAIARARAEGVRYRGPRVENGKEIHDLVFQGWVFNAVVCRVGAANGKVTSTDTIVEDD